MAIKDIAYEVLREKRPNHVCANKQAVEIYEKCFASKSIFAKALAVNGSGELREFIDYLHDNFGHSFDYMGCDLNDVADSFSLLMRLYPVDFVLNNNLFPISNCGEIALLSYYKNHKEFADNLYENLDPSVLNISSLSIDEDDKFLLCECSLDTAMFFHPEGIDFGNFFHNGNPKPLKSDFPVKIKDIEKDDEYFYKNIFDFLDNFTRNSEIARRVALVVSYYVSNRALFSPASVVSNRNNFICSIFKNPDMYFDAINNLPVNELSFYGSSKILGKALVQSDKSFNDLIGKFIELCHNQDELESLLERIFENEDLDDNEKEILMRKIAVYALSEDNDVPFREVFIKKIVNMGGKEFLIEFCSDGNDKSSMVVDILHKIDREIASKTKMIWNIVRNPTKNYTIDDEIVLSGVISKFIDGTLSRDDFWSTMGKVDMSIVSIFRSVNRSLDSIGYGYDTSVDTIVRMQELLKNVLFEFKTVTSSSRKILRDIVYKMIAKTSEIFVSLSDQDRDKVHISLVASRLSEFYRNISGAKKPMVFAKNVTIPMEFKKAFFNQGYGVNFLQDSEGFNEFVLTHWEQGIFTDHSKTFFYVEKGLSDNLVSIGKIISAKNYGTVDLDFISQAFFLGISVDNLTHKLNYNKFSSLVELQLGVNDKMTSIMYYVDPSAARAISAFYKDFLIKRGNLLNTPLVYVNPESKAEVSAVKNIASYITIKGLRSKIK